MHDIGSFEEAKQFGTVLVDDIVVTGFEEKPPEPKTTLVNTGCSLLPKNALPVLMEHAKKHPDNVGGVFEELLRRNMPIECFAFTEPWFDIGSFDAYIEATKELVGNKVASEQGVAIENTECIGSVVIGEHSSVMSSVLENVVLFEDCIVDDCVLRNCVLDKGCKLQGVDIEGKMLREGTSLKRT